MSFKESPKVVQLKRDLAVALKDEILEKVKPGVLFRSGDNRKFYRLDANNGNPIFYVLNSGKLYNDEFEYKLRTAIHELVQEKMDVKSIALYTGCWGMTDCPVGVVRQTNKKDLEKYFGQLSDKMCDLVREAMNELYCDFAEQMGLIHPCKSDDDEWAK